MPLTAFARTCVAVADVGGFAREHLRECAAEQSRRTRERAHRVAQSRRGRARCRPCGSPPIGRSTLRSRRPDAEKARPFHAALHRNPNHGAPRHRRPFSTTPHRLPTRGAPCWFEQALQGRRDGAMRGYMQGFDIVEDQQQGPRVALEQTLQSTGPGRGSISRGVMPGSAASGVAAGAHSSRPSNEGASHRATHEAGRDASTEACVDGSGSSCASNESTSRAGRMPRST